MPMDRRAFLRLLAVLAGVRPWAQVFAEIQAFFRSWRREEEITRLMPVLFVGHGSPMNLVQENSFTRALRRLGRLLPRPRAIVCISAHWLTRGSWVQVSARPEQIYDFYGFPEKLYRIRYRVAGEPEVGKAIWRRSGGRILPTARWGIDHGTWTVLYHMYPRGDIPVLQVSIDYRRPLAYHVELARVLRFLREQGVLIIGSGNITHNLSEGQWQDVDAQPYDWAMEFDARVKEVLQQGAYDLLLHPVRISRTWAIAHPEPSHWIPLIYSAFLHDWEKEPVSFPYEGFQYGSISMRCVAFGWAMSGKRLE